ncbi:MAG TPA: tyrosine-type recombinase/integrase [Chloroflexota bacterium]|nr:tyrosine-type recombinase/integrase [Chloroflexota bacterium]
MSSASAGAPSTSTADPSVLAAQQLFLDSLVGKSPRTVATYASALRRWNEHLRERKAKPELLATSEIGEEALEAFQRWLIRSYGRDDRATITTYVAGVRAFFRFLSRRHMLNGETSFEAIQEQARAGMGRASYRSPRVDSRLANVVLYVKSVPLPDPTRFPAAYLEVLRDRAIILTLFSTGMRREEASRLDRADLDDGWNSQAIIRGKGDRERVVFFSEEALEALRAYFNARNDSYAPAFIRHDRARGRVRGRGANYRLSPLSIWKTVKKISLLADVPATTHDFRHAKATVLLNQGAKLSEVQDILGHASPETTKKIYAHYEVQHLRDAFDRYSLSAEEMAERHVRRRDQR